MDLVSFVQHAESPGFLLQNKTICFYGPKGSYPLLFFTLFFKQLKKNAIVPLETIASQQEDAAAILAKLSTSFLGTTSLYWLKNISDLKAKKSKQLLHFLQSYDGPNSVSFFVDGTECKPNQFACFVELPERIEPKQFANLVPFLGDAKISPAALAKLFGKSGAISLDNACLLLQYQRLSGRALNDFIAQWKSSLIASEHYLLSLSKHFFVRDVREFFVLWGQMVNDYSPQFWIAFWSEQLWRACNVADLLQRRQFEEAKRVSFRLPYNFTQRLWQHADLDELRRAHDFLYSVDCSLKNGGTLFSLELFYSSFFVGEFKSTDRGTTATIGG